MKDKVMKLALALCEQSTMEEINELCGYLQTWATARAIEEMHENEYCVCEQLAEELI